MGALARWTVALAAGAALSASAPGAARVAGPAKAAAAQEWEREFEAVCARTQDAMTVPEPELRALVTRCDALRPRLEALEESSRKVWLKRLQLCRDLYQFVLDAKEQERKDRT